jgi:hypothetical protein
MSTVNILTPADASPLADMNRVDEALRRVVLAAGRIDLASAVRDLRAQHPEITSFEVAQSVSRLHRHGLIRIDEQLVSLRGEQIRTAVLSVP